jgi:hypothetical protein
MLQILAILTFIYSFPSLAGSMELQNCTPSSQGEEASARRAADAAQMSDTEALARLIYAEGLSTGFWKNRCSAPNEAAIFESIAWGVMNRVGASRANARPMKDIVFARSQFRTSFSSSRNNPFAVAFLCPLRAQTYLDSTAASPGRSRNASALYQNAENIAQRVMAEFNRSGIPANRQNISNFFYPRSEHFGEMRPTWAPNADPTKNRGFFPILGNENPCVEFYCPQRSCSASAAVRLASAEPGMVPAAEITPAI